MTKEIEINNERNYSRVLKNALDVGEMMHICGAEASRIEDTVSRICYAYGVERADIFTITSSIIVTIILPNGDAVTQTRRISSQSRDMTRLDALNALSRDMCEYKLSDDEVQKRLNQIKQIKGVKWYLFALASIMAASGFTFYFGGSPRDAIATAVVALIICGFEGLRSHIRINSIVYYLIVSFVSGAVSVLSVHIGLGQNVNAIMIGAIMLLIPGIAITFALENLLTGDTITGLLQFFESIILAVIIAGGFAFATFTLGGYDMLNDGVGEVSMWIRLGVSPVCACGFSMIFGVIKPKRLAVGAVGAILTELTLLLFSRHTSLPEFACVIIAATVGATYGQIMARVMRVPSTVFTVPAVITLIPGSALYYTMSWALRGNTERFIGKGIDTLLWAFSISFGIVVVLVITSGITAVIRRTKIKKHR